jgi:fructose PTS system EIIB component
MNVVAITACPTGIAHSQMAAENLEQTAKKEGHDIRVEIQGAMGAEDPLTREEINGADAAIIAADTSVNRDRFEDAGIPVVKGTVKEGINDALGLFERAREAAGLADGDTEAGGADDSSETVGESSTVTSSTESEPASAGSQSGPAADLDPGQIGGDPRKGLFARLRRLLS